MAARARKAGRDARRRTRPAGLRESAPPENPSIVEYHRFIGGVARSVGDRPPVLVGHDLGGLYALTYALAHPGGVRGLVLLNTTIYPDPAVALGLLPLLAPGFGEAYSWLAGRARWRAVVARELRTLYPPESPDEVVAALVEPYARSGAWLAIVRAFRGLSPARVLVWKARMPGLTVPVLVLWGRVDPYFPASVPERLSRDLPRARLEYLAGAGHFPMLSRPDEVADSVRRFVLGLGA
ncbi:MAG: alpha/beta hydrolase [Chloroflexia bacterium]